MDNEHKYCGNCEYFKRYYIKMKDGLLKQDCGLCYKKQSAVDDVSLCGVWKKSSRTPLIINDKKRLLKEVRALLMLLNEEIDN